MIIYMSDILGFDDDGLKSTCIPRMSSKAENDYTIDGSIALRQPLRDLIDTQMFIFIVSVKGKSMDVPSMKFDVDKAELRKQRQLTAIKIRPHDG